ncbi:mycothiol transferase [Nocardia sp. NBC_01329]|uniref:mycothiol transferase n=1 Tax=Nocardia sp. NBC_01329 TaxID=2903594 RepID=UPI002E1288E4|nr:DinB family protein [Nocardia sp. NBC_01329]
MNSAEILTDAFDRIRGVVHDTVDGLDEDALKHRLDPGANTIAWLVWHLTRVQDEHLAELRATESLWTGRGWYERFDLPIDRNATGYGDTPADVALISAPPELLTGYHDAVHTRTVRFLGALHDRDLDAIVDTNWDPPVTMGVRLVSVIADDLQHAGQAAFIRGALTRAPAGRTGTAIVR